MDKKGSLDTPPGVGRAGKLVVTRARRNRFTVVISGHSARGTGTDAGSPLAVGTRIRMAVMAVVALGAVLAIAALVLIIGMTLVALSWACVVLVVSAAILVAAARSLRRGG